VLDQVHAAELQQAIPVRIVSGNEVALAHVGIVLGLEVSRLANGEVVDGHLQLKAARKLGLTELPVILCGEWTPAQVKAFRLMVNRSMTWADWDDDLLSLELLDLKDLDFDLGGVYQNFLRRAPLGPTK
jgi:hypothetical protein